MKRIGVVGLGKRMKKVLGDILFEASNDVKIVAITDVNDEKIKEAIDYCPDLYAKDVKIYADVDKMLSEEELDGVFIGTRCNLHTKFAIKVIEKGIPLFLEKPVSINMEEIKMLKEAMDKYNPSVMISFPLRHSEIVRLAKEIIDSGKIGKVEQVQAYNDVPYGRVYYHDWYRDDSITEGLWLQKATHDLDCINYILGMKPVEVCAMESKQIFKGNKPKGLKCIDCEEYNTCPESPKLIEKIYHDRVIGEYCSFAEDTGNHDSASAILRYANGMHASYSQNFFARKKAGRRGGRYYGYKGTLEFDLVAAEIKVYMHNTDRVETYKFDEAGTSHYGGDAIMMNDFLDMMDGKGTSILEDGIYSALMCIKAKESSEQNKFIKIPDLDNV